MNQLIGLKDFLSNENMIKKRSKWIKNDQKASFYEIRFNEDDIPVLSTSSPDRFVGVCKCRKSCKTSY